MSNSHNLILLTLPAHNDESNSNPVHLGEPLPDRSALVSEIRSLGEERDAGADNPDGLPGGCSAMVGSVAVHNRG